MLQTRFYIQIRYLPNLNWRKSVEPKASSGPFVLLSYIQNIFEFLFGRMCKTKIWILLTCFSGSILRNKICIKCYILAHCVTNYIPQHRQTLQLKTNYFMSQMTYEYCFLFCIVVILLIRVRIRCFGTSFISGSWIVVWVTRWAEADLSKSKQVPFLPIKAKSNAKWRNKEELFVKYDVSYNFTTIYINIKRYFDFFHCCCFCLQTLGIHLF